MSNPKKNAQHIFYMALPSTGNAGQLQMNPTIAAGDFQVSTDGGTFANLATLPTVTPAGGVQVKVTVAASETNGDQFTIKAIDAAGDEWDDVFVSFNTSTNDIDDVKADTAAILVDTGTDGVLLSTSALASVNAEVDAAIGDAALATAANLATVDTVVDAIKVVTDALPDAGALTTIDANIDAILLDTGTNGVVVAAASKTGYDLNADQSPVTIGTVNALGTQAKLDVNAEADTAISDAALATAANLATVDTVVDAIKAVTDNLPDSGALTTIASNISAILSDTGTDGVVVSTAQAQAIADEILKRGRANVQAGSPESDSIYELLGAVFESDTSGAPTWTIKHPNGTTFSTRTLTTDPNADPVVAVT